MYHGLLLCAFFTASYGLFQCPPDYCKTVDCEEGLTEEYCAYRSAVLKAKSSLCGCCDTCVQQLKEGDSCASSFLLGTPPTAECGPDLMCNSRTSKCSKISLKGLIHPMFYGVKSAAVKPVGPCTRRRKQLQDIKNAAVKKSGSGLLGMTLPSCKEDGSYEGKQCSGSKCYCVESNGQEIEGYDHNIWESNKDIKCECARAKERYRKTGLIGRMFACDDYGDYEPVQCTGSVCHCADKVTGQQVGETTVNIGSSDSLNC